MTQVADTEQLLTNGQPLPLSRVPVFAFDDFCSEVGNRTANGSSLSALFGVPNQGNDVRLYAVLSRTDTGQIAVFATDVGDHYPALTPTIPQAHWFEREIAEQWGIVPDGHPWLKPIRFHHSYSKGRDAWGRAVGDTILPCVTNYFRVEGEDVHEVAVGPVHAGVIEPGHFRFQCYGETVFTLEIELGFQHRGIERRLVGGPTKNTLHYMETLSGDTTIGHSLAYVQVLEGLAAVESPLKAQTIRAIALELERLACHTGDLGAIAQDIGFLPTSSFCGRLRGDFLNTTAVICGNRFGRSIVRPGGVRWDITPEMADVLTQRVETALRDVGGAANLLWNTPSVMARLEEVGTVSQQVAGELGLVGMAARASGIDRDIRRDFPSGIFRFAQVPAATWHTGDAFARAYIRWLEVQRSARFILDQLKALPGGPIKADVGALQPDSLVVSLTEGWRGEICHVAITNDEGRFAHYKVVDPSFHNWIGLAMSLRNQEISDFPLCNKSFNLSYCGHDL